VTPNNPLFKPYETIALSDYVISPGKKQSAFFTLKALSIIAPSPLNYPVASTAPTSLFLDVSYNARREIETNFNFSSSKAHPPTPTPTRILILLALHVIAILTVMGCFL